MSKKSTNKVADELAQFGARGDEYRFFQGIIAEMSMQHNSGIAQKIDKISKDLKSNQDGLVLHALEELNYELTMKDENQLASLKLQNLVPEIQNCQEFEGSSDIMDYASIALNHILELSPKSSEVVVKNGGQIILAKKLQTFDYINSAENAIKCFEKLSLEYSNGILNIGGLAMMINIINFQTYPSQNSILVIISRMFRSFAKEDVLEESILPILPELKQILIFNDQNHEICCEIYLNLIERINKIFANDSKKREALAIQIAHDNGLIPHLFIISNRLLLSSEPKAQQTFLYVVRLFNRLAFQSSLQFLEILQNGVDKLLISYIENNDQSHSSSKENNSQNLVIHEIISQVNTFQSIRALPSPIFVKIADLAGIKILEHTNYKEKLDLLNHHKHLQLNLLKVILEKATEVYEITDDTFFKYVLLTCMEKIMIFLTPAEIIEFTNFSNQSIFLTMILDTKDMLLITIAIQITQALVPKISHLGSHLVREGFIQTLEQLSSEGSLKGMSIYSIKSKKMSNQEEAINLNSPAQFQGIHGHKPLGTGLPPKPKEKEDEFLQQLMNWQDNPSALLNTLSAMKSEQLDIGKGKDELIAEKAADDENEDQEDEEDLERIEELRAREEKLLHEEEMMEEERMMIEKEEDLQDYKKQIENIALEE